MSHWLLRRLLGAAVTLLLALTLAQAHIELVSPPPRTDSLKNGPCGARGGARGAPTVVDPTQPLQIVFDETINHPGWYRISFDDHGQDFPDPSGFDDTSEPAGVYALARIVDVGDRHYAIDVDLPDIACDDCTLQVIQVMTDKRPYGDGNDIYYQCADLTLVLPAVDTDAPETDAPDTDAPDTDAETDAPDTDAPSDGVSPTKQDEGACGCGVARPGLVGLLAGLAALRRRRDGPVVGLRGR